MDKIIGIDQSGKNVLQMDGANIRITEEFVKDSLSNEEIKEKKDQKKIVEKIED